MIEKSKPKKRKKEAIYEAAAQLFREKGYKAASMRDLAERVDLKVSSLYSHIGSKEELLQKICFDNAKLFVEGMNEIECQPITTIEKIKALIALHVDIAVKNPTSVTVFNDEWKHLANEGKDSNLKTFLTLRKDYENRFQQIIIKGIEAGELKNINSNIALYTILTSVRWLHYWYKPTRSIQPELLKKQIANLLLDGVAI
ncbi:MULTISPECIES: TetR/AcrR family transcriptional regulator [unclassified Aureispira]|uniref:TetR/AcrR family transcriptional regulator n=1 Tax=unclassified Aureispira TaxID=2649989 RepID=UPI000696B1B0|nr:MULTISPECIES: TetR/AcrR family transcriptional regulator [unclassified Aureispira]WMX12203.1 TetR/AcrR family transcriptional regulator [Aureispira sp. CCB-E]